MASIAWGSLSTSSGILPLRTISMKSPSLSLLSEASVFGPSLFDDEDDDLVDDDFFVLVASSSSSFSFVELVFLVSSVSLVASDVAGSGFAAPPSADCRSLSARSSIDMKPDSPDSGFSAAGAVVAGGFGSCGAFMAVPRQPARACRLGGGAGSNAGLP